MSHIEIDIPDLDVNVTNDLQTKRVILRQSPLIINQSSVPLVDVAAIAISASYAHNVSTAHGGIVNGESYTIRSGSSVFIFVSSSGNVSIGEAENLNDAKLKVQGNISASAITGSISTNEFQLNAGTVSMIFTGSVNAGIFGVTEYVQPYISTTKYSGMTVEYLAQRPGACRMGIIMSAWLNTGSITFTDISTTDIGDTTDISFAFLTIGDDIRLRVNSNGSGSGAWTVQSVFKLFPNLNS